MITKDVARHEFIGLATSVAESRNKSLVGLKGKLLDETKNTFVLLTDKKERKNILKKNSKFIFTLRSGEKVKINGTILVAKPEERIKMKIQ